VDAVFTVVLRNPAALGHFYLGNEYGNNEIELALQNYQFGSQRTVHEEQNIERRVADYSQRAKLSRGSKTYGIRRALFGNRSILANPAAPGVVKLINEMIKCRDFWMPFAPSCLPSVARSTLRNQTDASALHDHDV